MLQRNSISAAIVCFLMAASPAYAGIHAFVDVPEPGSLSLIAVATAAAAIAFRFRNKK